MEQFFKLKQRGTTVRTELVAGLTTFMVMAYIIFVNPSILSTVAGPEYQGALLVATCVVAGLMTLLMGFWTNYPFALAPGMGINSALVALVLSNSKVGLTWQEGMAVIFLEGLFITILVLTGLRQAVMDAIPMSLKRAISVGIGLFILFIGLTDGGFVRTGEQIVNGGLVGTLTTLGVYNNLPMLVAFFGLLFTIFLMSRKVKGSLLWGILGTTAFAMIMHYITGKPASAVPGAAEWPKQLTMGISFKTFGAGLHIGGLFTKLGPIAAILTIFAFMLSDFFDTMGTVIGIGSQAGWVDKDGRMEGLREILIVDSLAAMVGGLLGSSSATTYIESAAGVEEGGRSGLTSVVVGVLFLVCIFLAPLAGIVPSEATAPALIIVGFLMCQQIREIPFGSFEEGVPALFTMVMMPFSWSITNGVAWGFVTYVFLKVVNGKSREVSPLLWGAAIAFVLYLIRPLFGVNV